MSIEMKSVVPCLRIFSVEKAKEFYEIFLGFKRDWDHRYGPEFPLYMQVSRSGVILHLTEHMVTHAPAPCSGLASAASKTSIANSPQKRTDMHARASNKATRAARCA